VPARRPPIPGGAGLTLISLRPSSVSVFAIEL
jgi:hypothetical protein